MTAVPLPDDVVLRLDGADVLAFYYDQVKDINVDVGNAVTEAQGYADDAAASAAAAGAAVSSVANIPASLTKYTDQRLGIEGTPALVAVSTNGRTWHNKEVCTLGGKVRYIQLWARANGNMTFQARDAAGVVTGSLVFAPGGVGLIMLSNDATLTPTGALPVGLPDIPAGGSFAIYDANNVLTAAGTSGDRSGGDWEFATGLNAGSGGWTAVSNWIQMAVGVRFTEATTYVTYDKVKAIEVGTVEQVETIAGSLDEWTVLPSVLTTGHWLTPAGGKDTVNAAFRYYMVTLPVTASQLRGLRITGSYQLNAGVYAVLYYDAAGLLLSCDLQGDGAFHTGTFVLHPPSNCAKVGLVQLVGNTAWMAEALGVSGNVIDRLRTLEAVSVPTHPLTIIGDSLALAMVDDITAAYPARTKYDMSIGGENWQNTMRYRLGVALTKITVTGGVIPASGAAVACTFTNAAGGAVSPWYHTTTNVIAQVSVKATRCKVKFIQASGTYTIQRIDPIAADVAVPAASEVRVLTGHLLDASGVTDVETAVQLADAFRGTLIIRTLPSTNDRALLAGSATMFESVTAMVDEALEYFSRWQSKIVCLGGMISDGMIPGGSSGYDAATSYNHCIMMRTINNYLRSRAPRFVDVMASHEVGGDVTTVAVNGVNFKVLQGTSDGIHETATQQARTTTALQTVLNGAPAW